MRRGILGATALLAALAAGCQTVPPIFQDTAPDSITRTFPSSIDTVLFAVEKAMDDLAINDVGSPIGVLSDSSAKPGQAKTKSPDESKTPSSLSSNGTLAGIEITGKTSDRRSIAVRIDRRPNACVVKVTAGTLNHALLNRVDAVIRSLPADFLPPKSLVKENGKITRLPINPGSTLTLERTP